MVGVKFHYPYSHPVTNLYQHLLRKYKRRNKWNYAKFDIFINQILRQISLPNRKLVGCFYTLLLRVNCICADIIFHLFPLKKKKSKIKRREENKTWLQPFVVVTLFGIISIFEWNNWSIHTHTPTPRHVSAYLLGYWKVQWKLREEIYSALSIQKLQLKWNGLACVGAVFLENFQNSNVCLLKKTDSFPSLIEMFFWWMHDLQIFFFKVLFLCILTHHHHHRFSKYS